MVLGQRAKSVLAMQKVNDRQVCNSQGAWLKLCAQEIFDRALLAGGISPREYPFSLCTQQVPLHTPTLNNSHTVPTLYSVLCIIGDTIPFDSHYPSLPTILAYPWISVAHPSAPPAIPYLHHSRPTSKHFGDIHKSNARKKLTLFKVELDKKYETR